MTCGCTKHTCKGQVSDDGDFKPVIDTKGSDGKSDLESTSDPLKFLIMQTAISKAQNAGFTDADIRNIFTIILMESTFNPSAKNGSIEGLGQLGLDAVEQQIFERDYQNNDVYKGFSYKERMALAKACAPTIDRKNYDVNIDLIINEYNRAKASAGGSDSMGDIYPLYVYPRGTIRDGNKKDKDGKDLIVDGKKVPNYIETNLENTLKKQNGTPKVE